jgi:DNA (cytosine-5)-methyltransferase 1
MISYEIGLGMSYLTICDGLGAVHLAWQRLGWSCVGVSEVASFPKSVVKHRWEFRDLGDLKRFREWPEPLLADVDLLVGGTPCPSFSVAGNREGLTDERGMLALVFLDLWHHINTIRRKYGRAPALLLWENVDGALTMKDNSFGQFVGRLLGCDEAPQPESGQWHNAGFIRSESTRLCWRVLNAQDFAVAQRRKRVFLLGVPREMIERFGERACPSRILALRCSGEMKPLTLKAASGIMEAHSVEKASEAVSGYLDLPWLKGVPRGFSLPRNVSLTNVLEAGPVREKYYVTPERALKSLERAKAKRQRLPPLYEEVLMRLASGSRGVADDLANWAATEAGSRVDLAERDSGDPIVVPIATSEVANTLTACLWNGFRGNGRPKHGLVIEGDRLRLLTCREWERAMGFPDDFTLVPNRKNELAKDSPRFIGLGNSIVVPVLSWIGQRIAQAFNVESCPARLPEQHR